MFTSEENDTGGGRGVGKSTVVLAASQLFNGHLSADTNEKNFDSLKTRLLSPGAMNRRIVLLDNCKSDHFSSEGMESLITETTISGKQLYFGNGSRPNTLTIALTANGARLNKDMADRIVPVVLSRPQYDPTFNKRFSQFIEKNRWFIIADLIHLLEQPSREVAERSRWATWEQDVLSKASNEPTKAITTIIERRGNVDEDQEQCDLVADAIRQQLRDRHHDPEIEKVIIPTETLAKWLESITGAKNVIATGRVLSRLKIPELDKGRSNKKDRLPGYVWCGKNCPANRTITSLNVLNN